MVIYLQGGPLSNNSLYKRAKNSFYMTHKGKALKESYQWQMKVQMGDTKPFKGELEVTALLYFPDKRKHDYDNYGKILNDAGNGILWEDDNQIIKATIWKNYRKGQGGITLEIGSYTGDEERVS